MNTEQALEMIIKRLDAADKARVRIFKWLDKLENEIESWDLQTEETPE